MLDDNLKAQLKAYLERLTRPVEIIASLDDSKQSDELRELLDELQAASALVRVETGGEDERRPSFSIRGEGTAMSIRFAAIPLGHEFASLVLALLWAGGHPPKVDDSVVDRIRAIDTDLAFEVYMSLSCHNCPDVVQALNMMAVINPRVSVVTIDGGLFQKEVEERDIMAVPSVFLDGKLFASGRMGIEEILAKLATDGGEAEAKRLDAQAPYDMLMIGGGPAGAAAAIYAARKGLRTGVAAERFGGQVLDTLSIENYIAVPHTDGPSYAVALEQHVREYDVDIMNAQRAIELVPADEPGGLATVRFANGGRLRARTVVLATGARWREINVPGEAEYRNRGVAYCPHCDGPLYKGKRVAVIGGGNSGVEAAIDLAGVVEHVTLIEFAPELRADAVLVAKLRSLDNVRIITNARTTSIDGDGQRVTGLTYVDRATDEVHTIELAGVFVQIGLVPNTDWLQGTVELTRHGEIVVDERGQTSVPGIFAAGDATTVPYKQIVIAAGDGAKAALSAFDYLIRTPALKEKATAEAA